MRRPWTKLRRDERGTVAPTVALSLVALIACGGIAFDYARLAALDTELQDAADQSALAGASQLDGQTNAVLRATAAAQSLLANQTVFGNDGGGPAIQTGTTTTSGTTSTARIFFYGTKADADADTNVLSGVGLTDAAAHFIKVAVVQRKATYAMTPIVGALSSGNIGAEAVAGLGSAICKVPPVMMCNPAEPTTNTNTNYPFDGNALRGDGMLLVTGTASAPGNFGFLDTNFGSGASNLAAALGYNSPPGDCSPTNGVSTKPGMNAVVMNALNTRFDINTNGANTCPSGGTCSASRNSRKDLVKGGAASANCGITGNGWSVSAKPYRPAPAAVAPSHTLITSSYPDIMGHPRDICHAVKAGGDCTFNGGSATRIGDGVWDRNAYFKVNYGWATQAIWMAQTGLSANATRYEVYQWELAHPSTSDMIQNSGSNTGYSYPVCLTPGITPNATTVDRRRISVAVLNCHALGLNGAATNQPVLEFIDAFLVEPSFARGTGASAITSGTDVYLEVIGETVSGAAGSTAGQVVRRDSPYLVK